MNSKKNKVSKKPSSRYAITRSNSFAIGEEDSQFKVYKKKTTPRRFESTSPQQLRRTSYTRKSSNSPPLLRLSSGLVSPRKNSVSKKYPFLNKKSKSDEDLKHSVSGDSAVQELLLEISSLQQISKSMEKEKNEQIKQLEKQIAEMTSKLAKQNQIINDLRAKLHSKAEKKFSVVRKQSQNIIQSSFNNNNSNNFCSNCNEELSNSSETKKNRSIFPFKKKVVRFTEKSATKKQRTITFCDLLGSGASGAKVFRCIVDGWSCAAKKLDLSTCGDFELDALETEMDVLYTLPVHPNVIQYLFHETIAGELCFFMTLHDMTLHKYLQKFWKEKNHFVPPHIACYIALQVVKGLEHLHSFDILHRDIKTDNVLLSLNEQGDPGSIVITDFDTATKVISSSKPSETVGTKMWMAPEVLRASRSDSSYTFSADVYSFGMLLFELLTCNAPYSELNGFKEINKAILSGILPQIEEEIKICYSELYHLHCRCIAFDATLRPSWKQIGKYLSTLNDLITQPTNDNQSILQACLET